MTYDEAIQVMQDARLHCPALVCYGDSYHVFSRTRLLGSGNSYEAALTAAKLLPRKPRRAFDAVLFNAVGVQVVRGNLPVCTARTPNMALRIAHALNRYTPNDRGF
jgi:hypothetical protein